MNEMNDVLNKFKEERELLMRTFTEGYKKLSKDKDEELEKMLKKAMEEERSEQMTRSKKHTRNCLV
ncbi:hypothetical protein DY000_02026852 [Brassica cretica]|nr:hypothetical protein DY000_02026852 [Brassica cretica]